MAIREEFGGRLLGLCFNRLQSLQAGLPRSLCDQVPILRLLLLRDPGLLGLLLRGLLGLLGLSCLPRLSFGLFVLELRQLLGLLLCRSLTPIRQLLRRRPRVSPSRGSMPRFPNLIGTLV